MVLHNEDNDKLIKGFTDDTTLLIKGIKVSIHESIINTLPIKQIRTVEEKIIWPNISSRNEIPALQRS
jgi:hypothetical protein